MQHHDVCKAICGGGGGFAKACAVCAGHFEGGGIADLARGAVVVAILGGEDAVAEGAEGHGGGVGEVDAEDADAVDDGWGDGGY